MKAAAGRRGVRAPALWAVLALSAAAIGGPAPAEAGPGPFRMRFKAFHSGKVLDVPGGSLAPGTALVQWTDNGGANQRWRILTFSTVGTLDLVLIRSERSGQVLDLAGAPDAGPGAAVVQRPWSGALSQLWIVLPFGSTPLDLVVNVDTSMVLDVGGAQLGDGAPVIQWPWHGGANQVWDITHDPG